MKTGTVSEAVLCTSCNSGNEQGLFHVEGTAYPLCGDCLIGLCFLNSRHGNKPVSIIGVVRVDIP